jgi:hypothetical protein
VTAIGVIGGSGSVGRATVAQLRDWGLGPVVVAGRDPARADVVVDVGDQASVQRFCASVRLVINCSASSPPARAAVAEAAAASSVPYVDPGGDEPLHELLSALFPSGAVAQPVLLSAGMWPGLTSLLPRQLPLVPGGRLSCYVGGLDRFTVGAAADYLAVVNGSAGRTFAVWRDGSRVERAGLRATEGEVPCFPEGATGVPYLSQEMERLAQRLRLAELVFYPVFPGARLRETLAVTGTDAEAVVRASELDLFGHGRYQRLVFRLHGDAGLPTLAVTGKGSSELTGATAAMTALAVLEGAVGPGVHFAADVLDPAWAKDKLLTAGALTGFRMFEARPSAEPVEEGVI